MVRWCTGRFCRWWWRRDYGVRKFLHICNYVICGFFNRCCNVVGEVRAWNGWGRFRLGGCWAWFVGWMRVIRGVAVPVPPPAYSRFKHFFAENVFGSRSEAFVEEKPKKVFVVSLGRKFWCTCLFHLSPCFSDNFLVVSDSVSSAVSTKLLFHDVA